MTQWESDGAFKSSNRTPWNPTLRKVREAWGTLGPFIRYQGRYFGAAERPAGQALMIFLLEKLRPRLRAIFRSSRKYHDFSKQCFNALRRQSSV
jgi:hypothetical protein